MLYVSPSVSGGCLRRRTGTSPSECYTSVRLSQVVILDGGRGHRLRSAIRQSVCLRWLFETEDGDIAFGVLYVSPSVSGGCSRRRTGTSPSECYTSVRLSQVVVLDGGRGHRLRSAIRQSVCLRWLFETEDGDIAFGVLYASPSVSGGCSRRRTGTSPSECYTSVRLSQVVVLDWGRGHRLPGAIRQSVCLRWLFETEDGDIAFGVLYVGPSVSGGCSRRRTGTSPSGCYLSVRLSQVVVLDGGRGHRLRGATCQSICFRWLF